MNPSPPTAGSPVTLPRLRYPLAYRLPLSAVQRIMTNTSTATCLVPGLSPSPFSLPAFRLISVLEMTLLGYDAHELVRHRHIQ